MNRQGQKKSSIKNIIIAFLILDILLLQGCILPISYHRTIDAIDTSEMVKYMDKKKIDTLNAFYFSPTGILNAIENGYNKILTIAIFDQTGQLYSVYPDSVYCQRYNKYFFNDEVELKDWKRVESDALFSILVDDRSLIGLNHQEFTEFDSILKKADYTLVIFWSVHLSKSKRIRDWQAALNKKDGFQYVTINLDVHSNWNLDGFVKE